VPGRDLRSERLGGRLRLSSPCGPSSNATCATCVACWKRTWTRPGDCWRSLWRRSCLSVRAHN
jgi:hypothetical protein